MLLKPDKKRKNADNWAPDLSMVPPHLRDLTMTDFPPKTCPWSLSGPQFPQPTAIQQRYCYPKGDRDYSSRKGGALWTMYERNGKEDLQYRLLHVYFSAKRAINKGVDVPTESVVATKRTPNSTPRRRRRGTPNRSSHSPWNRQTHTAHSTPRSIHTNVTESPLNTSDPVPSFRPFPMATECYTDQEIAISSITNMSDFLGQPFHPLPSFELESLDEKAFMSNESDFQTIERNFRNDSHSSAWRLVGNNQRRKVATQALMASDMLDSESSSWTLNYSNEESNEDDYRQLQVRLNALNERVREMIALEADKDNATRIVANWAQTLNSKSVDGAIPEVRKFSELNDAAICQLFARLGPRWDVIAKSFPRHSAVQIKLRFETIKKDFESGLAKIVPSAELLESEEALKHSIKSKDPNADPKILRYLADFLKQDGKGSVLPSKSFGPFRAAKAGEACKRCGLLVPSLQTGRAVCDKTGWCQKCTKLSAIVHGEYLREIYPLKLVHKNTAEV